MNTMDFLSPSMVNRGHQQLGQLDGVGGEDRHCRHPTHRGDDFLRGIWSDFQGLRWDFKRDLVDATSIGFNGFSMGFQWVFNEI